MTLGPPARHPAFLNSTAIAGVGYSRLSRRSGLSVLALADEAARNALADAGLNVTDVDGIGSFSWEGDSAPSQALATTLALSRVSYLFDARLGGQAPSYLVMHAAMAIACGLAEVVIVFRALNGRSGQRVGAVRTQGGASSYRYPIGLSAYPQLIALWARRYMIETGATEEDIAAVPLAQRPYALANERAFQRSPLTLEEYFSSPLVAEPFRAADCTPEIDGACALVVTSTTAARSMRHTPVLIAGAAYECGPRSGLDVGDCLLWDDYSRNYTSLLSPRLWGMSGMGPLDMDCAQLYDCFSSSVLLALEGLGFAERGGGADFLRSGKVPVNTNGGLLCEGYLHGMNTVAEAVQQLQGLAGDRSIPHASAAVVTSGAMMDGSALVLVRG